ncbi:SusD family protein [compost metagenome]
MKNFKILLFVAVASLFAACDDAIDIKQPSELLPENAFQTLDDLKLGLNGVYGAASGEDVILFTSIFTDEVRLGTANGGQGRDGSLAFLLNNNSGDAASIWVNNYALINFANRLLLGAKNITPTEEELPTYNNVLAETRALRAFGHFQLLTFFAPNMQDDNSLGVIAMDFVPTTDQQLPRNTVGEVFALINSDLDFAFENLTANSSNSRISVSKDFVRAFRARMAVYRGQYNAAEADLDVLIAAYGLTKKFAPGQTSVNLGNPDDLLTKSSYNRMFRDEPLPGGNSNPNEVIFKFDRAVTGTTGNFYQYWSSVNTTTTGSAFFEVATALFEKYNPSDIRRTVVIDPTSFPAFRIRPVGKYSKSVSVNFLADVKIFRASEMRLLKAEVLAHRSDFDGVAAQINAIRTARFNDATGNIAVPTNAVEAFAAILNERRLELAFEGHRYIDIKRLGKLAGGIGIDRSTSDFSFNEAYTLPLDDHRWTLPIPRAEASANPTIVQNPGYGN